jgi:hypothetical protein
MPHNTHPKPRTPQYEAWYDDVKLLTTTDLPNLTQRLHTNLHAIYNRLKTHNDHQLAHLIQQGIKNWNIQWGKYPDWEKQTNKHTGNTP